MAAKAIEVMEYMAVIKPNVSPIHPIIGAQIPPILTASPSVMPEAKPIRFGKNDCPIATMALKEQLMAKATGMIIKVAASSLLI